MRRKTITYVSSNLNADDLALLNNLRDTNKMKMHCYRMLAKRYRLIHLGVTMVSIILTSSGVIAGSITVNPLPIAVLSGVGLVPQGFLQKSSIAQKKNGCKEAYKLYRGITDRLTHTIQGTESYNHDALTSDINLIDGIVAGSDAVPINGISEKYYKKYVRDIGQDVEMKRAP